MSAATTASFHVSGKVLISPSVVVFMMTEDSKWLSLYRSFDSFFKNKKLKVPAAAAISWNHGDVQRYVWCLQPCTAMIVCSNSIDTHSLVKKRRSLAKILAEVTLGLAKIVEVLLEVLFL